MVNSTVAAVLQQRRNMLLTAVGWTGQLRACTPTVNVRARWVSRFVEQGARHDHSGAWPVHQVTGNHLLRTLAQHGATFALTALPACLRNGRRVATRIAFDRHRLRIAALCQPRLTGAGRCRPPVGMPQAQQTLAELLIERQSKVCAAIDRHPVPPHRPTAPQPLCGLLAQQTAVRAH